MKKNAFTVLCFLFALVGFSQTTEKTALDAAFVLRAAQEGGDYMFRIPGEYVQKDGKIMGQRFRVLDYVIGNTVTNEGTFKLVSGGDRYSARLTYDACTSVPIETDVYDVEYNPENKISKLEGKFFSNVAKQFFVKYFFTFTYKGEKIIKMTKGEHLYEGKTSAMSKLKLSYDIQTTLLDWSDDGKSVVVTYSSFYRKKKESEKQMPSTSSKNKIQFEENSIIKQKLDFTTDNVITTESIHFSVNEAKRELQTSTESLVEIYTLKDGKILKVDRKEFNSDKSLKLHTEILKQFEVIDTHGMSDACSYTVKDTIRIFDDQGNVTEERAGGKFRKKNVDGTWGEWQIFRL